MKSIDWLGLEVKYKPVDLGYEGDPSIPNGTRHMGWECDFRSIKTHTGDDIIDFFTDDALEEIEQYILDMEEA